MIAFRTGKEVSGDIQRGSRTERGGDIHGGAGSGDRGRAGELGDGIAVSRCDVGADCR